MSLHQRILDVHGYVKFPSVVPEHIRHYCLSMLRLRQGDSFAWPPDEGWQYSQWLDEFLRGTGLNLHNPSSIVAFCRPVGDGMRWHDDDLRMAGERRAFVCTYLTPTTEGRGALRIIPGSHHGGYSTFRARMQLVRKKLSLERPFEDYRGAPSVMAAYPDVFGPHPEEQPLEVPEGSVIVCDERMIHGTVPNAGPGVRSMVMTWYWRGM